MTEGEKMGIALATGLAGLLGVIAFGDTSWIPFVFAVTALVLAVLVVWRAVVVRERRWWRDAVERREPAP